MKWFIFLCLLVLAGCASVPEPESDLIQPVLVEQNPLPMVNFPCARPRILLNLSMLIDETGTIRHVKLNTPTGNIVWDSLVVKAIHSWKYTPAIANGRPLKVWVQQAVIVDLVEPVYVFLSEIVCNSEAEAMQLLDSLRSGIDFGILALRYSKSSSAAKQGFLGKVNINNYTNEVREVLSGLREHEYTAPLKIGPQFVIFKRTALNI
jgi:hypothetical protein